MRDTVAEDTIAIPAEWAPQKAIWTAWPADPEQWNGDLETPRRDVAAMVRALAPSNGVRVLVNGAEAEASARASLGEAAKMVPAKYGDIWLRDTGPIFARNREGAVALRFQCNGWGGKFDLPDDTTIGDEIAHLAGTPIRKFGFVLEGGAVEHDGQGTILTTSEVLLNANRNGWTEAEAEAALRHAFSAQKIIWLHGGLKKLGFTLGTDEPQSAIIAVIMPDLETGAAMWEALLKEGLYVNLARPPATPAGMTLLRCSLCAEHSTEQVGEILNMFAAAGRATGCIQ